MGKTKKPRENQKPKKQNFSENVWFEAHVWFFLVFLEFFCVSLVMTLKKLKNSGFFGYLKELK